LFYYNIISATSHKYDTFTSAYHTPGSSTHISTGISTGVANSLSE